MDKGWTDGRDDPNKRVLIITIMMGVCLAGSDNLVRQWIHAPQISSSGCRSLDDKTSISENTGGYSLIFQGFLDDVPSTVQVYRRSFLDDVPSR